LTRRVASRPRRPPATREGVSLRHAVLLGLLHGPAELLPISSSGHIALLPWLARWPEAHAEPGLRKALEVALHTGTAAALLCSLRGDVGDAVRELHPRRIGVIAGSLAPAAYFGTRFGETIERRLGTPGTIATGLIVGSAAMAYADVHSHGTRDHRDAGVGDGLVLGLAQAAALMPGVSRGGATLAAARARGFGRLDAHLLSRDVALPVIIGATALKLRDLRGSDGRTRRSLAAGAGAAFLSTLASTRVIAAVQRGRSLLPYAGYRIALATVVLRRLRREGR
jgi:undecaprenyl-diphosphatase